jgi:large subunit ribosomal protein L23
MKNIALTPVVTEKGAALQGDKNQYVFFTDLDANKVEIATAVEALKAGIEVVSVKTLIQRGKVKRLGRSVGKRSNRKKAIVRLKAGQTIELFESV